MNAGFGLCKPIIKTKKMLSTGQEWLQVVPVIGGLAMLGYVTYQVFVAKKETKINLEIKKDAKIVVDSVDIEDLGDKVAYCRCWKSKKFPLCDGSHGKHNIATGDNVGPLCLKRKEASE